MEPRSVPKSKDFVVGVIADVVITDLKRFVDSRGWLAELFRHDELSPEFYPTMSYYPSTHPGVPGASRTCGPSRSVLLSGPSHFKLRLWDNRPDSKTFNHVMTVVVGEDNPKLY